MIIAVDGTAASGKGTLARRLADHFGIAHLETGLLYRAAGHAFAQQYQNSDNHHDHHHPSLDMPWLAPETVALAAKLAQSVTLRDLDNAALRGAVAELWSSRLAAIPEVRHALMGFQTTFVARARLEQSGAVLDGRDIGTTICPDAEIKFFVSADLETRAHRRHQDWSAQGRHMPVIDVLLAMQERDMRDENREISPLKPAADAIYVDTTHLTPSETLDFCLDRIPAALRHWKAV